MKKDFDEWNKNKKKLHDKSGAPFFHEREVWWCTLGLNVGFEQDGGDKFQRPVLVVRKFNREVLWVLPLTTSKKINKYHFNLRDEKESAVILSQLRLISSRRLERLMYKLPKGVFSEIITRVKNYFPQ